MQGFIQDFLLGGGRNSSAWYSKLEHAEHAHLGGSGGMPPKIILEICDSEIESGGFGHLHYPNICVQNRFSCTQLKNHCFQISGEGNFSWGEEESPRASPSVGHRA